MRVRRARYLLPNGEFLIAERPDNLPGHFGPQLRAFVLHQYFHNQVTQPLLLEQLREFGVDISAGQVSRLLTEGHEAFHQEKETLLPAARAHPDELVVVVAVRLAHPRRPAREAWECRCRRSNSSVASSFSSSA